MWWVEWWRDCREKLTINSFQQKIYDTFNQYNAMMNENQFCQHHALPPPSCTPILRCIWFIFIPFNTNEIFMPLTAFTSISLRITKLSTNFFVWFIELLDYSTKCNTSELFSIYIVRSRILCSLKMYRIRKENCFLSLFSHSIFTYC